MNLLVAVQLSHRADQTWMGNFNRDSRRARRDDIVWKLQLFFEVKLGQISSAIHTAAPWRAALVHRTATLVFLPEPEELQCFGVAHGRFGVIDD